MPTKRKPKGTTKATEAPTPDAPVTLAGIAGFSPCFTDQRGKRHDSLDEAAANATPDDGEIRLTVQYIKKV